MQDLSRHWANAYDWRGCEKKLNDLPNFTTEIDGLDIHFIHVRSRSWAERAYPDNLIYFHHVERGGHFAAWEQSDLFSDEMRNAFRSLR